MPPDFHLERVETTTTRRQRRGIGGHHSAGAQQDEWLTPPPILAALGEFDLDPCSPIARPWPTARHHYTIEDNGLMLAWNGRVWLNPPYGQQTGKWLARMVAHDHGTALVFARTETEDWHRHIWAKATAIHFLEGRLYFFDVHGKEAQHNAGAPSALIAYGKTDAAKLLASGIPGKFVMLR